MDNKTVYDLNLFGILDSNGQIEEFYDKKAVENSLMLWLTSYNTDCLRRPNRGGVLTTFVYRPMSTKNATEIKQAIIEGLNKDYELTVKLINLSVEPDYSNKTWNVFLEVFIPEISEKAEVAVSIKNQV